jgi:phosphatidylglycerophosphate synthase
MLDATIKPLINPWLERAARKLVRFGCTANGVTVFGLLLGLVAALCIASGQFFAGLALVLISRIFDGLDGALARLTAPTDYGGFLDITLDFVFYGAIPLAFIIADPSANALAGATLIFSFYVNGASFLAFAVMAEKRGLAADERGTKSFFFSTGLTEATETIIAFVLFCLFPQWFAPLAFIFAAMCVYTAVSRIVLARKSLDQTEDRA